VIRIQPLFYNWKYVFTVNRKTSCFNVHFKHSFVLFIPAGNEPGAKIQIFLHLANAAMVK